MTHYLTKTAFKVASTCPTKLYYYLNKYPSVKDENEYLQELARNGAIIGKLAQLYFPQGVEVNRRDGSLQAVAQTKQLFETTAEQTIFEAGFLSGAKLAFVDILVKSGKQVELVEVKSKGLDHGEILKKNGEPRSDLLEHLEDIAFQYLVFSELYPDYTVTASLFVPDKSRAATIDGVSSFFEQSDDRLVIFTGETKTVLGQELLFKTDVTNICKQLLPEIKARAEQLVTSFGPTPVRLPAKKGRQCKDCEYRSAEGAKHGFNECWETLAEVTPHIFDLRHGTRIQQGALFDDLIARGAVSLYDVPLNALCGGYAERQLLQIKYTKLNEEYLDPNFAKDLNGLEYPLFFIDFETVRTALPAHKGLRPYELVAFQWSAHVLDSSDAELKHFEFLSDDGSFPNFAFAEALHTLLGDGGTILHWSAAEKSALNSIIEQLDCSEYADKSLCQWLKQLMAGKSGHKFVDLEKLVERYYFHPKMKGSTSLKYVLPAVWEGNERLQSHPWFQKYAQGEGKQNPYKALAPVTINGEEFLVKDGTGAIMAYEEMCYGAGRRDADARRELGRALREYCCLDTLAMVGVWGKVVGTLRPL